MSGAEITGIGHPVLTVASIERTIAFHTGVLGMRAEGFGADPVRRALHSGTQEFNLCEAGREFEPRAARPTVGQVGLCLLTRTPFDEVVAVLGWQGMPIIEGPVSRSGAQGEMRSGLRPRSRREPGRDRHPPGPRRLGRLASVGPSRKGRR